MIVFKNMAKAIEYFRKQYEWTEEEIEIIIEYLKTLDKNFVLDKFSDIFYGGIDNENKDITNFLSHFFQITPKQAWAKCLMGNDESISIVLSDYITQVFQEVLPLVENKQTQEAMKIFLRKYKEIKLKNWNQKENFFISYGTDITSREQAEREALRLRLIQQKDCSYLEKDLIKLPTNLLNSLKKVEIKEGETL